VVESCGLVAGGRLVGPTAGDGNGDQEHCAELLGVDLVAIREAAVA
jgi:hypothetical protein